MLCGLQVGSGGGVRAQEEVGCRRSVGVDAVGRLERKAAQASQKVAVVCVCVY